MKLQISIVKEENATILDHTIFITFFLPQQSIKHNDRMFKGTRSVVLLLDRGRLGTNMSSSLNSTVTLQLRALSG